EGAHRFVTMHHPDTFAKFPAGTAPVTLAGHTHGGQIQLPGLPRWSWIALSKKDEVHADGWIPDYGKAGNDLYVNRGIGMSVVPMRINCVPEMTVMTLQDEPQPEG
ncbi:MAG: metallophosphoesterase, partial [Bradymonadaceae bacterium]